MNSINEFVDATNRMIDEEQRKYEDAVNEKEFYSELKNEAIKKERAAKNTMKELELARLHAKKAQGTYASSEGTKNETIDSSEDKEVVYTEKPVSITEKSGRVAIGVVNILVAGILLLGGACGYKLYRESKTGDVKSTPEPTLGVSDTVKTDPEKANTNNNDATYNYENNEVIVVRGTSAEVENNETEATQTPSTEEKSNDALMASEEELTTDNFENMVAAYANKYSDQYSIVETSDITKFAVIANIDILAEENPELIKEIAGDKTKEEFLNDAFKLIGLTDMCNSDIWEQTKSTDNFIRISDIIYGNQKQQMLKIEAYIDQIAVAVNENDADLVNQIVNGFIVDLNSGELSKLDDGVGMVMVSYLLTMSDSIAKDYLNQENFDRLQVLKTSEKYISNIFTIYDKCTGEVYTRTR